MNAVYDRSEEEAETALEAQGETRERVAFSGSTGGNPDMYFSGKSGHLYLREDAEGIEVESAWYSLKSGERKRIEHIELLSGENLAHLKEAMDGMDLGSNRPPVGSIEYILGEK